MTTVNGLATQTDREIAALDLGNDIAAVDAARAAGAGVRAKLDKPGETEATTGVVYASLEARNPEYLGDFWAECRALYAGGARLLRDEAVMDRLFPKNGAEADDIYKARRARAFFLAYPGEIIDHLLAGLAQDPLHLSAGLDEKTNEPKPLPPWWAEFDERVTPDGVDKRALHTFAIDAMREMFITQSAWILVDLPARDPNAPAPANLLEEERAGLRDPYLCLMPSDNVVDWEVDDETGELEWALCYWRTKRRPSIRARRTMVTERWLEWTREGWRKYEWSWDPATPPKKDAVVPLVDQGTHPFGRVPLVRLQVPDGLYAMGKLHSPAREHFNKRCAVAHAENMSLFAVLYEFNGPDNGAAFTPKMGTATSAAQQDPRRSINQVRGQGYTQVRGHQDDARYVGPDTGPFKEARESCAELMREMHRVMFSMALSANMDAAALKRSGDSKEEDSKSIAAILLKVGEILRQGFGAILELVAKVRGGESIPTVTGGEKFDADSVAAAIEEATNLLNGVPMRSPTFMRLYLYRLYKRALGPDARLDDLEEIRDELETAITAEMMLMQDGQAMPPVGQDVAPDGADDEPDEDETPEKPAAAPAKAPAKGAPGTKRIIASGGDRGKR